jgi:hypothetical protein
MMLPHVVKFSLQDSHCLDLWGRLCDGRFRTYAHVCAWLMSTYQAHVIDHEPGEWYIQFPDADSLMEFTLTWM